MLLISKHDLEKALSGLNRIAPKKPALPILGCARLQTIDRQTVTMTATNLNEFLTCRIKVSNAPEGLNTLLPLSEVKTFIKGDKRALLKVEPVASGGVTISEEISGQTLIREFPAPEAKDFPAMPPCPAELLNVPDDFISTLSRVAPSTSQKDPRTTLHGILMSPEGLTGTDGKQLCHVPYPLPIREECVLRLPACLFSLSAKLAVRLGIAKDKYGASVTIETGNWSWTSKSLYGKYPNWQHLVPNPKNIVWKLELDKAGIPQLSAILQRLPDDNAHKLLKLCVKGDSFELFTEKSTLPVTCRISSLTGIPPAERIMIDREILLRALSLGHNTFEQMANALTPLVATGGLGKLVFMPWRERGQTAATTPSEQPKQEIKTMKQENGNNAAKSTATAKVVKAQETTKAPVTPVAANTGFKVVPGQGQADGYGMRGRIARLHP
ncbi:MAG: hypothetical protein WCV67_06000 [Victivallaceae bacterium]|jgi:DNA polymerase III sliding clamp (beta) subunit (PCNA family)